MSSLERMKFFYIVSPRRLRGKEVDLDKNFSLRLEDVFQTADKRKGFAQSRLKLVTSVVRGSDHRDSRLFHFFDYT